MWYGNKTEISFDTLVKRNGQFFTTTVERVIFSL